METTYPRVITIDSPKMKTLLQDKAALVEQGRFKSEEIEALELKMHETDLAIQDQEKKVDLSDLMQEQQAITDIFNKAISEMEIMKKRIYERMREHTDPALRVAYEEAKAKKEELEAERNKIALKIQQKNDKIIPLAQKLMKPFLQDEYEDYDSMRIENGEVVGTIFSHMNDFIKRHLSKQKK